MSDVSANLRRSANYLDASGYKEFAHAVELLRSYASQIELNEARATVDALDFTPGEVQTVPFSFTVTHGKGPTYTPIKKDRS